MRWTYQGEVLTSELAVNDDYAELKAFGGDNSVLLSGYGEADYQIKVADEQLIFTNLTSNIELTYDVVYRARDVWELRYLNEMDIHLQRISD